MLQVGVHLRETRGEALEGAELLRDAVGERRGDLRDDDGVDEDARRRMKMEGAQPQAI